MARTKKPPRGTHQNKNGLLYPIAAAPADARVKEHRKQNKVTAVVDDLLLRSEALLRDHLSPAPISKASAAARAQEEAQRRAAVQQSNKEATEQRARKARKKAQAMPRVRAEEKARLEAVERSLREAECPLRGRQHQATKPPTSVEDQVVVARVWKHDFQYFEKQLKAQLKALDVIKVVDSASHDTLKQHQKTMYEMLNLLQCYNHE